MVTTNSPAERTAPLRGQPPLRTLALALLALVTLSACQPAVYLMPTPIALRSGDINPFERYAEGDEDTRVPVWYATNRLPITASDPPIYSIFPSDDIRLGKARLRIGEDELDWASLIALSTGEGAEDRPRLFLEELSEQVAVNLLESRDELPPSATAYFAAINAALAESLDKDLLIYVHGANASVYRASAQAAQYRHFTGRNSVVMLYAWPSAENLLKYRMDVRHAASTVPVFARFIELLAENTDAEHINILAYSAGAQVTAPALALLAQEHADESIEERARRLRIGEVYFAAPDTDLTSFVRNLDLFIAITDNVTMTVNLNDSVLRIAQLASGVSRAGRPDLSELNEAQSRRLTERSRGSNFDVIDIDPDGIPGLSKGSHSYWYDHPWISTDVLVQFLFHARPGERGLTVNETDGGGEYWTFPPDYDARIVDLVKGLSLSAP
jgi:esterase/lipase superfamily enzyme